LFRENVTMKKVILNAKEQRRIIILNQVEANAFGIQLLTNILLSCSTAPKEDIEAKIGV